MPARTFRLAALCVVTALGPLAACGQKGPLTLPDETEDIAPAVQTGDGAAEESTQEDDETDAE